MATPLVTRQCHGGAWISPATSSLGVPPTIAWVTTPPVTPSSRMAAAPCQTRAETRRICAGTGRAETRRARRRAGTGQSFRYVGAPMRYQIGGQLNTGLTGSAAVCPPISAPAGALAGPDRGLAVGEPRL